MKRTNKQVIEINIEMAQFSVDRWLEKMAERKLTKKEVKAYKEDLRRLERFKDQLKSLELLGEEMYTKVYPFR